MIIIIGFLFSNMVWGQTLGVDLVHFESVHQIESLNYESNEECAAVNGSWTEKGTCVKTVADTVDLVFNHANKMTLNISIQTRNDHSCTFSAEAKVDSESSITATAAGEVWDSVTGLSRPTTCVVKAQFVKNLSEASVSNNGQCESFCGENSSLEIQNAKRFP